MNALRAAASCTAILAVAAPLAAAKGKPPAQGEGCKPKVTVVLKGTLTSDPAPGATSLTMEVTGTNQHGKGLKGVDVTIALDAKTKVRRQGAKTIGSLAMDDRATIQLRRCKADLPLTAETVDDAPALRVTAQASKD
jgi:hypothetical protein